MTSSRSFPGTATHRMIHGALSHTAAQGSDAAMAGATRFAQHDIFVIRITNLPDGRVAILVDAANFTRWQTHLSISQITRHQRRRPTRASHKLAALALSDFDVVHRH